MSLSLNNRYNVSVASIFKNESHILDEWILHYLQMGVEHFFLVNNNSNDQYQPIISAHSSYITLYHDQRLNAQIDIYNDHILPIAKAKTKWLLVVDLDEFVYNPKGCKFIEILAKYRHFGGVACPWVFFGSSGFIEQPNKVVDNFVTRQSYCQGLSMNVKNFYQIDFVSKLLIHSAEFKSPYFIVSSKSKSRLLDQSDVVFESDLDNNRFDFVTNHYAIQSLNFFRSVKSTRGDVNNLAMNNIRDLHYFRQFDHNDIYDDKLKNSYTNHMGLYKYDFAIIGFPTTKFDSILKYLINKYNVHLDTTSYFNATSKQHIYYNDKFIFESVKTITQFKIRNKGCHIFIIQDTSCKNKEIITSIKKAKQYLELLTIISYNDIYNHI